MNLSAQAVLKTLCYSDIFDYPLTEQEIYHRLVAARSTSPGQLAFALAKLVDAGVVCKSGSYYYLSGRTHLVKKRLQAMKCSQVKISKAKLVAIKLMTIPYVQAVFLTGAVAVNNANLDDDIDIMVITSSQSLWTARFLVTAWLELNGLRRRPNSYSSADQICVNLYLSRDRLAVPNHLRNLYTAHEVVQVQPLVDPLNLYAKFIEENSWIKSHLNNFPLLRQHVPVKIALPSRSAPAWLETMLYKLQLFYMQSKRTREFIVSDAAYFHPRDLASEVLTLYNKKLEHYHL